MDGGDEGEGGSRGNPPDRETPIEWSRVPDESLRAFTIVWRAEHWVGLAALDEAVRAVDPLMVREHSNERGGLDWSFAAYGDSLGRKLSVERTNPDEPSPVYVRIMFDVDDALAIRSGQLLAELVQVARRLERHLRARLGWYPIALET